MVIPEEWKKYKPQWSEGVTTGSPIDAQILMGCDITYLHPRDLLDEAHQPIETTTACFKVSTLTYKLLAIGHNPPKYPVNINHIKIKLSQDDGIHTL